MKKSKNKLVQLFFANLYISAFTFGGGFVIITFMKRKFVDELHWIEEDEMLNMAAIAQSSPGAIAVNGAIVVYLGALNSLPLALMVQPSGSVSSKSIGVIRTILPSFTYTNTGPPVLELVKRISPSM